MNKDYSINFKIGSELNETGDLIKKATQAEKKLAGLENTIKGIGLKVGSLALNATGLGNVIGAVNFAGNVLSTAKTAKASITDFLKQELGAKHVVEFSAFAEKLSKDYKLDQDDIMGVMYNALQNKEIFNSDPKRIKQYTENVAKYVSNAGKGVNGINDQIMKVKKMKNFPEEKLSELLDLGAFFKEKYGIKEEEFWEVLEQNLQNLSENANLEEVVNLYKGLFEKIGNSSTLKNVLDSTFSKIEELKEKVGSIKLESLSLPAKAQVIKSLLEGKNEDAINLLLKSIGLEEDLNLKKLGKEFYKGNIKGRIEKFNSPEAGYKKLWNNFKKEIGVFFGIDRNSFDEKEQQNNLSFESFENQGLSRFHADGGEVGKCSQNITNYQNNNRIENTYIINEATNFEDVKRAIESSNNEMLHILNNEIKERNNIK